ncbi:MAG: hypothetical protein P8H37_01335, partial [Paracoccaceae bacterium]|nr:hypothetical protein [Paracoccaceae bacterium]
YWRTVSEQYRRHIVKAALDVAKFCFGAGLTGPTSGILERSSAMRAAFFSLKFLVLRTLVFGQAELKLFSNKQG